MKFYLHYDKEGDPDFTMVIQWNEGQEGTVQDLIQMFCRSYNNANGSRVNLQVNQLMLTSNTRKPLASEVEVCKIAEDKDDFFLVPLNTPTSRQTSEPPASPGSRESVQIKKLLREAQKLTTVKDQADILKNILEMSPNHKKALLGLGEIYLKADRPEEALIYFKKALKKYPNNPNIQFWIGDCYLVIKDGEQAYQSYLTGLNELDEKVSKDKQHDLQVQLSKALALQGNHDAAILLARNVALENREHLDAMVQFAMLTYQQGELQASEAMTIMLTALIRKRGDKMIQKNFAALCKMPNGLHYLEKETKDAWNSSETLFFLGITLRNNGALDEAITLMKRAHELDPHNPSNILCYVHMLEVEERHDESFSVIRNYLKTYPDKEIAGLRCSLLLPYIEDVKESIYLYDSKPVSESSQSEDVNVLLRPFSEDELYLLALLFTLIKILFTKGALSLLPPLLKIVDPLHSKRELHQTLIRNEAAYFACISQIFSTSCPFYCWTPRPKFIYFVSDSHCIPPAWQKINFKGSEYVIHPILSTGTKIWHLGPDSVFYPKINFFNSIKNIPPGATTIFALGEIDCREGLLISVEKCRYKTLDAAMNSVIDIYIKLLLELKEKHKLVINVHPVPPTLTITRTYVNQFNDLLKKRLNRHPDFHWLDFVDKLFVNTNTFLLDSKYEFDGTHLHPCYVTLLEEALQKKLKYKITDL